MRHPRPRSSSPAHAARPAGFPGHCLCASIAALATCTFSTVASAAGAPLRADLVDAKTIKLDGIPKEWPSNFLKLTYVTTGKAGKPDLDARGTIAYDATRILVAVDVTDDVLRGGADHAELVLGFPNGAVHRVLLYPGEPGKTAGVAKKDGKAIADAKVVEAPSRGGYSLEASIPWSTFDAAQVFRIGLRGAIYVYDSDASAATETVIGTASASGSYAALPPIYTEPEQALQDGLLRDKGLRSAPNYAFFADVAGNAMKEQVLVYERYFVVLGPGVRKGTEYYWNDMGIDASQGQLPACEARDVTGDGQAEIVMRKRFGSGPRFREIMQIVAFGSRDVPQTIFQHEIGLTTEAGSIVNPVSFVTDGGKTAIVVQAGTAKGFDAGNYHEKTETTFPALLLPWGTVQSRTYKLARNTYVKAAETQQAATAPKVTLAPPARAAAKPPPVTSAAELAGKVYAAYKRDRRTSGKPRFDLAVDVAEDKQVERVLLHDRDLVVLGKGFKQAKGYSFLTLTQFASPADILDMTARDVTGDGKAEIVVKGIQRAPAPRELGPGTLDREVVLVFQVAGDSIKRIFAAETGLSMGTKRITGGLKFVAAGKGVEIEMAPGKAVEWTEATYPFSRDTGPVGGFEPLVLPWGGNKPVRYKWNGSGFSR